MAIPDYQSLMRPVLAAMGIKACAVADLDFGFTVARKGASPLLPKEGDEMESVKTILKRLEKDKGVALAGNGLPTSKDGQTAADGWAVFAQDGDGKLITQAAHETLKGKAIWIWPMGCIEQVTGTTEKGEDAIIEQEQKLREMSAADIEVDMPAFKACFDWIRSF